MKILAGISISAAVLFGASEATRPDPFFQSKNQITYSSAHQTKGWGTRKTTLIITVDEVIEKQSSVSSVCKEQCYDDKQTLTHECRLRFSADSLNFYANATNLSHENWSHDEDFTYSGDSLWYPYDMQVGDTLRRAWAKKAFNSNGVIGTERWEFTNRKVVALDTFELTVGNVIAYKIEMHAKGISKTDDKHTGNKTTVAEYDVLEWFSPSLGIVKTLNFTKYGDTRTTMESYKK